MLWENASQKRDALWTTIETQVQLDQCESELLGPHGALTMAFKWLKDLSPEEKKIHWPLIMECKKIWEARCSEIRHRIEKHAIDKELTMSIFDDWLSVHHEFGALSLLARERRRVEDICVAMGCDVVHGHELVSQFANFFSVNIPPSHPATEMHDTIFSTHTDADGMAHVMRTHTSSVQNTILKTHSLPIRAVVPGKVYRFEKVDASHDTMFYQLEWVVLDHHCSVAHCKQFLTDLLTQIFDQPITIRMRPWYFPFVEPWFEIDASCPLCQGQWCSMCKQTWWVELLGAGMIHPEVLRHAGLDPHAVSWFAFGIGINRIVALKHGITDIRYFTNHDLFTAQSLARI